MRTAVCLLLTALSLSLCSAASSQDSAALEGFVFPFRSSLVNAKTVGSVSRVLVEEGQQVKEGDLLVQLDDALAVANVEMARLQAEDTSSLDSARLLLQQAERELARQKKLGAAGSEQALEQAQYTLDTAAVNVASKDMELKSRKALLDARQAVLDEYRVLAPFSGVVARKAIEVGESTAPIERQLFQIIDISRVYVEVHPETALLESVRLGDAATVTSELLPGSRFSGKVSFVSPSLDPGGRRFGVKILVDNPDQLLRPGMKTSVAFAPVSAPEPSASPEPSSGASE